MTGTTPEPPVSAPADERVELDSSQRRELGAGSGAHGIVCDEGPAGDEDRVRTATWVSSSYFAEGFPYTVVHTLSEALYTSLGASLSAIGLTSLLHLPWNLKFLWSPLVDRVETKQRWIVGTQLVMAMLSLALAILSGFDGMLGVVGIVFLTMAVLSATQDIAVDGYYMEALRGEAQARWVGWRAAAYKIGAIVVSGPLLVVGGWVGWPFAFATVALLLGGLALVHAWVMPRVEAPAAPWRAALVAAGRPRGLLVGLLLVAAASLLSRFGVLAAVKASVVNAVPILAKIDVAGGIAVLLVVLLIAGFLAIPWWKRRFAGSERPLAQAVLSFLDQPSVIILLAFVIFFRTGESFLLKMKMPFVTRELGMDLGVYGWVNGTLGLAASFVGTFLGGWLIARGGLRRWLWPCVLAQNVPNLLFAGLAFLPSTSIAAGSAASTALIGSVIVLEQLGAGMGTAVFMVYLMRCCAPEHKAAHMAVLTALMSVSFTIAGVGSGVLAEAMGFSAYFVFTFLATIPAMVLIPFAPWLDVGRGRAATG